MGTGSCSGSTLTALSLGPDRSIWAGSSSGCVFRLEPDRFGGFANFRLTGIEAPKPERDSQAILALRVLPDGKRVEIFRRRRIEIIKPASLPAGNPNLSAPLPPPLAETDVMNVPGGLGLNLTTRGPDGRLWALMSNGYFYEGSSPGSGQAAQWNRLAKWDRTTGGTPLRMLAGRSGSVWIASSCGVFEWKDGKFRAWGGKAELASKTVLSLHEDRSGCLWVGLAQSIGRICRDRVESIPVGAEQEELLLAIAEDPQGNIWVGGRWGNLYRLSPAIFQSFTRREGLPESHLTGVAVDRDGAVWGSLKELGLVRIADGRMVENVRYPGYNQAQALVSHPDGGVIAAGSAGLLRADRFGPRPIQVTGPVLYRGLTAITWENGNALLLANAFGNFRLTRILGGPGQEHYSAEQVPGPQRIRQWTKDPSGRIWALAQYAGLHYMEDGAYYAAVNAQAERARGWYSLSSDRDGLLWIGTTDGLEIYSTRESRYLTAKPLLFGNQIFHISEDRFGKIWCATRQGLLRFWRRKAIEVAAGRDINPENQPFFERFGEAQALPTTNFGLVTSATGATDLSGRIWFPGLLGLVSLQPADFERVPRPPAAVLLRLNSDGKPVDLNQTPRIAPGQQSLEFLFQTIRLDPLGGEFCRVRLEGYDAGWGTCNEQRTAQYTKLPPGDYTFLVQTSSQPGTWNGPELRVQLTVEPAFHQRAGVRALAVLMVLAGLGFLLWNRHRQLIERTRWLEQKVEERTATLETAKHAAEAANRAKTEFLATMSHEIRTPMNGVLGAVQILDDSPLDLDQKQLVSVIRESGENLVSIVDDILSLARVEAGKLTLERSPVNTRELGETLIALFRPKAESKGVNLCLKLDPSFPEFILSDPQRLRQILLNLVGNAVKFTALGEVWLNFTSNAESQTVTFQVRDTGLGIETEKIPSLFQPFVQADSSTTRQFGGSGLGLSIARRFVDAMGGEIHVESQLGKGSVFSVTLPCEATSAPETPPSAIFPPVSPKGNATRGLTVLLAEDNQVNQLIFRKMLIRLGCEVILAKHGREALDSLRDREIDLVLMDCQMPELDGYQTTRELRSWGGAYKTLPVIALTASAMAEDRQHCIDAGMNDFLSKPLLLSSLETALAQWSPTAPAETTASQPLP